MSSEGGSQQKSALLEAVIAKPAAATLKQGELRGIMERELAELDAMALRSSYCTLVESFRIQHLANKYKVDWTIGLEPLKVQGMHRYAEFRAWKAGKYLPKLENSVKVRVRRNEHYLGQEWEHKEVPDVTPQWKIELTGILSAFIMDELRDLDDGAR